MCVGFWSLDDPVYSLILCANRDEFLERPTLRAHFHNFAISDDVGDVLSGIDVQAGGSWMGINRHGRIAFLTNITEEYKEYKASRGALVSSFLQLPYSTDISTYLDGIKTLGGSAPPSVGGFNLLLFDPTFSSPESSEGPKVNFNSVLVTNSGGEGHVNSRPISDEEQHCGGLSNGVDGREIDGIGSKVPWTKVSTGRELLDGILQRRKEYNELSHDGDEMTLVENLMDLLSEKNPSQALSRLDLRHTIFIPPLKFASVQIGNTPIESSTSESSEAKDSSSKPPPTPSKWGHYGTRLSTVILVRRDGQVLFVERDRAEVDSQTGEVIYHGPSDWAKNQRLFRFSIPKQG